MARVQSAFWIAPIALALLLSTVYPVVCLMMLATTNSTLGKLFSAFVGLKQFGLVFADSLFLTALAKSIACTFFTSALQFIVAFATALLFAQFM